MFEWLKTPSGAYNLTLILATIGWLLAGVGIFAGFHLNKVRTLDAMARATQAENQAKERERKAASEIIAAKQRADEANRLATDLERKQQPRQISQEQAKRFLARVKEFPKGEVHVFCVARDRESFDFGQQLMALLAEGGYELPLALGPIDYGLFRPPFVGLRISVLSAEMPPAHAEPLKNAIEELGHAVTTGVQQMKKEAATITIGLKP